MTILNFFKANAVEVYLEQIKALLAEYPIAAEQIHLIDAKTPYNREDYIEEYNC